MFAQRLRGAGMALALILTALPSLVQALSVPDGITLNRKGQLYEPFAFNHARHIQLNRECADCHHHTTGTLVEDPNCIRCHRNSAESTVVRCRGCHPADPFSAAALREKDQVRNRYHLDKPGLKGAMHQSCIGCHRKVAQGPTGCTECHKLRTAGEAFYHSGQFAPKRKPGPVGH